MSRLEFRVFSVDCMSRYEACMCVQSRVLMVATVMNLPHRLCCCYKSLRQFQLDEQIVLTRGSGLICYIVEEL